MEIIQYVLIDWMYSMSIVVEKVKSMNIIVLCGLFYFVASCLNLLEISGAENS